MANKCIFARAFTVIGVSCFPAKATVMIFFISSDKTTTAINAAVINIGHKKRKKLHPSSDAVNARNTDLREDLRQGFESIE